MFHLFYDRTKSAFDTSQQILQQIQTNKVLSETKRNREIAVIEHSYSTIFV